MSMYPIIGYLGFGVIVVRVHVLAKYMITRYVHGPFTHVKLGI